VIAAHGSILSGEAAVLSVAPEAAATAKGGGRCL
jgi:hypothetical protein